MTKNQADSLYKAQILAVDDEPHILFGIKHHLESRGYQVRTASNGLEALQAIEQEMPDLLILDLMMPDLDGLEVTRRVRLRMHSEVPIIILSAQGDEQKKVEALDEGADDYLTKPFGTDELLARIRVALRHKKQGAANTRRHPQGDVLGDEHLSIDLSKHLVWRDGKEVKLTPKQYELLKFLALNPDRLVTHHLLLQSVWGPEYGSETQYLHVLVGQLRQKIEPNPAKPRYILTEPGLGYRFRLSNEELS